MTSPKNSDKVVSALVHRHIGRAAVVMGGAPSLPDELTSCPMDAVYISAKEHGVMLRPVDYVVCCDNVEEEQRACARGAPIIAPHQWADFRIFGCLVPNSGAVAVWCAWLMGCAPIIVVGCQLYSTGTYWHNPKKYCSGVGTSVDQHLSRWRKVKETCVGAQIRVMRGPLLKLYKSYNPAEEAQRPPRAVELRKACSGVIVEFLQSFPTLGAKNGDVMEVHPNDASNLRTARIAMLVKSH